MKKIITSLCISLLLALLFLLSAGAEASSEPSVTLNSVTLYSYPDKTVYGAFEQLDTGGLSLLATYSDGSERIISGSDLRVSYLRDKCLRVGDDSVTLTYGGKSISLPVTVNRISYDLSALALSGFSTVYNGKYQSYDSLIPKIVGLDGIPLTVKATGGGVGAGEYDISIDFSTESLDYLVPESRVITMTVTPATAEIVWSGLSFTYDGKSKAPVAYYTDVNGARVYPTVTGAATNAGTGYIARVTVNDPNYQFTNTSVGYEIKKADYDFSGVSWSKDSFTYDGSKKSISASGLPAGVSIIGYTGDRGTDAGIYTAVATLSWDERNYNTPSPLTHTWEIAKADYNMSGVEFRADSVVFDGNMHYPTLVGMMPRGADGIQLEYSFSAGASHVSDGTVSVVISFKTASKNYNVPDDRHSSISITPLGIDVIWGEVTLSYNGEDQAPEAFSDHCVIKVDGMKTTVGKYTATATTENTDYYIKNDKIEYSIIKAENSWTEQPASSTCFEGKDIVIKGAGRFGNVVYTFYADPEGKTEIPAPKACGSYYVRLTVAETENFGGLSSDIVSFEIVEIVPVSFLAALKREDFCAFDKISPDDIVCSVINNDGSIDIVKSSLVTVIYESGNSLRRSDRSVTLKYGNFSFSVPIDVGYADYDLSGVRWVNTEQTYDGSARYPELLGLPDGVTVQSYLGGEMINAGSYKVYVKLNYDSENYNDPDILPCDFIINKCPINTPIIKSVYNGQYIAPTSSSSLYTVIGTDSYNQAGKYTVSVMLTDPENYVFAENGGDIANAIFEITPATVSVMVYDVSLKLFEKLDRVDYEVTGGVVYSGDFVGIAPYEEDGMVYIRSTNPNYVLDVEPGKINRLPYPTAEGFVVIIAILFVSALLILIGIKLYRHRHRLVTVGAALKCRWHNRHFRAERPRIDPPRQEKIRPTFSYEIKPEAEEEPSDSEIEDEEPEKESPERDEGTSGIDFEIDADKADTLITDSLARSLIKRDGEIIYTDGTRKAVIGVEDIAKEFASGQRVDVNKLKEKKLVPPDTAYLKVLGGGTLDKPLSVYANEFSLSAVKMIALTGGQAIKIVTMKEKSDEEKE